MVCRDAFEVRDIFQPDTWRVRMPAAEDVTTGGEENRLEEVGGGGVGVCRGRELSPSSLLQQLEVLERMVKMNHRLID